MSNTPDSRFVKRLIHDVDRLLQEALDFELLFADELRQVDASYDASARNLLHYLGVRRHDIRKLQDDLSSLGLSSLGRMEAHTLATLEAVLGALARIDGQVPPEAPERQPPIGVREGPGKLAEHANTLLGTSPTRRSGRVMVTMPSEAAGDATLIRDLLGAGMNIMRINCAHDDAAAWLAMVENLRQAERDLGLHCRILADLGGPKLRTGAISGDGEALRIRPTRSVRGIVLTNAVVWFTSAEHAVPPPVDVDAVLPLVSDLVGRTKIGDVLRLVDCRGRKRRFAVTRVEDGGALAECDRTSYLEPGLVVQLRRMGRKLGRATLGEWSSQSASLVLRPGDRLRVTRDDLVGRNAVTDDAGHVLEPAQVPCTLGGIMQRVARGERVWFDDGKIGGSVVDVESDAFLVEISHTAPGGSKLRADKGINLPDTKFDMPALTDKDQRDLEAVARHVDMVGLSFVRRPDDVELLVERLDALGVPHLGIVLKIENRRAFERLPRILLSAMRSPPVGVMVARGDLAVEMGFERLAEVQEEILWMCEAAHVPVIWATQVLESLAKNGAPSRAEVTDAAMSGRAECVMLNKGPHIVEATRFLSGVLERMESHQSKKSATLRKLSVSEMAP